MFVVGSQARPGGQQFVPQVVVPLAHTHWPDWHTLFGSHWTPHAPQLLASELVSMQTPLQQSWPRGQSAKVAHVAHFPLAQCCPFGHTLPQPPQLLGSLLVSTQVLPQHV